MASWIHSCSHMQFYVDYVNQSYRHCTVVFHGYEEGPTMKDPTHKKMSRKFRRSCCKLYIPHCNESEEGSILKHHCEQTDIYQYTAGCLFQRTDFFILNAKGDTDLLSKQLLNQLRQLTPYVLGITQTCNFYSVSYYADVLQKAYI